MSKKECNCKECDKNSECMNSHVLVRVEKAVGSKDVTTELVGTATDIIQGIAIAIKNLAKEEEVPTPSILRAVTHMLARMDAEEIAISPEVTSILENITDLLNKVVGNGPKGGGLN